MKELIKPQNWKVLPLNEVFDIARGGSPRPIKKYLTEDDDGVNWIKIGDTKDANKYIYKTKQKIKKEGIKKSQLVKENDFILSNSMSFGRPYIMRTSGCIHDGWLLLRKRLNNTSIDFMYYLLGSDVIKNQFKNKAAGSTVQNLNIKLVSSVKALIPPYSEQQKIAEILSTVDEKIEVIDQQILETEELKKGLMQLLFRKGIGHREFKNSPLGKIPKNWEVKKLKDLAKCFVGIASSATHAYRDSGITLVRNQNIKPGKLALNDVLFVDESYEIQHKSKRLKAGDILTVRTGYPGVSAVVPSELEGHQSFTTLITRIQDKTVDSNFVCAFINSEKGKNFFTSNQAGGGQKNVGSKTLETMLIPVPSIGEQRRIFEIANAAAKKIEILKKKKFQYGTLKKGFSQKLLSGQIRANVPIEA